MTQRHGTTLTEVLVAIFIMAIGMMSLLTLFPVGALTMGQAIKDDRVSQAAANAAAVAEARGLRHDGSAALNGTLEYWFSRMATRSATEPYSLTWINANYDGPSYPVLVDPLGRSLGLGDLGQPNPGGIGIPRALTTFTPLGAGFTQAYYRWFSLLDDLTYKDPAVDPDYGVPPTTVQREGRYTWSVLVQRPRFRDHATVDMTILVYNARSQSPPLGEVVFTKPTYDFDFIDGLNVVGLTYGPNPKPDIRKGSWIMDATVQNQGSGPGSKVPAPYGFLYRVVNVTDTGTRLDLELQSPPRKNQGNPYAVLIYLEGVAEVFHKGAGWQP